MRRREQEGEGGPATVVTQPTPAEARFVPGARLALVALLLSPLVVVTALSRSPATAGLVALITHGSLLLLAYGEFRWLRIRLPAVTREHPARLLHKRRSQSPITLANRTDVPLVATLREDAELGLSLEPNELTCTLGGGQRVRLVRSFLGEVRGDRVLGDLHLRVDGVLGLAACLVRLPGQVSLSVVPEIAADPNAPLRRVRTDRWHPGLRATRRAGQGGEFEKLREYVHGDPTRDLDWKATAKRQRPITRMFQAERSQTVILSVDASRSMAPALDGKSKLDHALEAALSLAHVALSLGDKVGVLVFAGEVQTFVPPAGGQAQYRRILRKVYDAQPSPVPADFRTFLAFTKSQLPRRGLMVLMTDLTDASHGRELRDNARMLRHRHLPLVVTMRDPVTEALLARAAEDEHAIYAKVAAVDFWEEQQQLVAELQRHGIPHIEASASRLAAAAVDQYLAVKARSLL